MKKSLMIKLKNPFLIISSFLMISFVFAGNECNILDPVATDITGTWELVNMQGDLQDVCIGEIATFNTNGTAQLRCPNALAISRQYTFENGTLTYTDTGVSYTVTSDVVDGIEQRVMTGRNVNRTLTYNER